MISTVAVMIVGLLFAAAEPGEVKVASSVYIPRPPAADAKESAQTKIDRAVLSKENITGLAANVQLVPIQKDDQLRVDVIVDAKELEFVDREGKNVQQLTFTIVLFDDNGQPIAGKQGIMNLALGAETLTNFRVYGLRGSLSFPQPKVPYKVRVAIREAVGNRIGAWTIAGLKK